MSISISAFDAFDVTLPAIEMILAKVNTKTSRQLTSSDFVLSAPIADPDGTHKTTIRLLPNVASIYYNPINVEYNRVVLSELFAFDSKLSSNDRATLYQILPYLNAEYGINITQSDVYDAEIDFLHPDNNKSLGTVVVKAKPESVLFFGEATVRVNVTSADGISVNEDDRVYYALYYGKLDPASYPIGIPVVLISRNVLGIQPSEFSFLGGTQQLYTGGGSYNPFVYKTANNEFVIYGENMFLQTGTDASTKRACTRVIVDATGALLKYDSPRLPSYGPYNIYVDSYMERIYAMADTGANDNIVYFDLDGNFIGSLNQNLNTGTQVVADSICLGLDKSLYISHRSSDVNGHTLCHISALSNDLIPLAGFTPIEIRDTEGNNITISVMEIIDEFIYLSVSTFNSNNLIINGEPLVFDSLSLIANTGKIKPLLRFNRLTGEPDTAFNAISPKIDTGVMMPCGWSNYASRDFYSLSDTIILPISAGSLNKTNFAILTKAGEELDKPFLDAVKLPRGSFLTEILPVSNSEFLLARYRKQFDDNTYKEYHRDVRIELVSKTGAVGETIFEIPDDNYVLGLMMINPDE